MPQATLKILIVDDDAVAARGLMKLIAREGHEVSVVADPLAALRAACRLDVDVVICDEKMPDMRGSEILASLARLRPHCFRALTTSLLSAAALVKLVNEVRVEYVLEKPFDDVSVRALLRAAQNGRRESGPSRASIYRSPLSTVCRDDSGAILLSL